MPKESSLRLEGQQRNKHIVFLHLFYKVIVEERLIKKKSQPFS